MRSKISEHTYQISQLILYLFLCNLVFVSGLLFFHVTVNRLSFILSVVLAFLMWKRVNRESDLHDSVYILLEFVILLIVCMMIAGSVYSNDCDGNAYHKMAVGLLKNGWNPIAESADIFGARYFGADQIPTSGIWIDHYAKASWIFASGIYSLTGNIECGKVYNILSAIAGCGILYHYLQIKFAGRTCGNVIIAFLTMFNPILIAQVFTYYIDGYLCIMLFILIVGLFMSLEDDRELRRKGWLLIVPAMIVLGNIKFTGLLYGGIYCVLFYGLSIYKHFNSDSVNTHRKHFLRYGLIAVVTVFFVGYPTYVQNFLEHGNPVYPLAGDGNTMSMMIYNAPAGFEGRSNVFKLFYSLFSKMENVSYDLSRPLPELKLPFTMTYLEYLQLNGCDTRIEGFGFLFSGILIISVLLLVYFFRKAWKERKKWLLVCLGANVLLIVLLLLVISESWWARYSPYFYLLVVFAMVLCQRDQQRGIKVWFAVLACLLFLNNMLFLRLASFYERSSYSITQTFRELEGKEIYLLRENSLTGLYFNLKDYEIHYHLVEETDSELEKKMYYDYLTYEEIDSP